MGTYLDVRRYPAFDDIMDEPDRYGARLGLIDVTRDGKNPLLVQQFWSKIRHQPFLAAPVIPLLWGVLEYTLQTSMKTGKGPTYNTARHCQESPASGLCLSPLEENASIPSSHLLGQRQ
jgi:hypothetical protein